VDKYDAARTGSTLVNELKRVVEVVDYVNGRHVTDSDALVDVLAREHVRHLSRHVEDVRHAVMT